MSMQKAHHESSEKCILKLSWNTTTETPEKLKLKKLTVLSVDEDVG